MPQFVRYIMTTTRAVLIPTDYTPRWLRYMFLGAGAGFIVALGVAFVLALINGQVDGLSPGSCMATACALTLMLSQPVALSGMLTGAVVGAAMSGAVYLIHGAES